MKAMIDVLRECRIVMDQGANVEAIVRLLRDEGLSKVHSIKVLVDLGLADMGEAKRVVHRSPTWADVRERDDDFQQKLGEP